MSRALIQLQDGWERLLGADPGGLRARFALRLGLTASVTAMGLIGANHWGVMPIGGIGLGFMIAQFSAAAVRDRTPGGQILSTLASGLAGLGGAIVASLVSPYPIANDVVLVLLAIAVTAIRPAGARAMACGMLAFIGYYLSLIIHVPLGQVPFEVAGVAYAVAVVLLVRLLILPDRPLRALPRVLDSVRWQAARVLEAARESILAAEPGRHWTDRLVRQSARLEQAVEAVEDQIGQLGGKPAEAGWSRLGMVMTELQLQVLRVARLSAADDRPPPHSPLVDRLAWASANLGLAAREFQAPGGLDGGRSTGAAGTTAEIEDALRRLSAILVRLPHTPEKLAIAAREPIASESEMGAGEPESAAPQLPKQPLWPRLLPVLRQPIQVGVATGVAIVAGHAVSGRRWYWSVLAVFIVFVGTTSRVATLTKAMQRVLGTLLGAGIGILIAGAVHGHTKLIVALALLADAFAFYAFQAAYSVMIFWITIMIALLYSLLGIFHPELLVIRIDETAVGVAAGIVVAVLLLPQRTSDAMRIAGLKFLRTTCEALDSLPGATRNAAQAGQIRKVARAIQGLRGAAGPLGRGWVVATPLEIRLVVRWAMATSYWMQELAITLRDHAPGEIPSRFGQGVENLKDAMMGAHRAIDEHREPPQIRCEQPTPALPAPALTELASLAGAINRYVQALDRVARMRRQRGLFT